MQSGLNSVVGELRISLLLDCLRLWFVGWCLGRLASACRITQTVYDFIDRK